MKKKPPRVVPTPEELAPLLEGLYERVARQAGLDASVVASVARGEVRSKAVELALEHELRLAVEQITRKHANGPRIVENRSRPKEGQ